MSDASLFSAIAQMDSFLVDSKGVVCRRRNLLIVEPLQLRSCKLLNLKWWPGTESNRRRRPFQGRLPDRESGLKSTVIAEDKSLTTLSI